MTNISPQAKILTQIGLHRGHSANRSATPAAARGSSASSQTRLPQRRVASRALSSATLATLSGLLHPPPAGCGRLGAQALPGASRGRTPNLRPRGRPPAACVKEAPCPFASGVRSKRSGLPGKTVPTKGRPHLLHDGCRLEASSAHERRPVWPLMPLVRSFLRLEDHPLFPWAQPSAWEDHVLVAGLNGPRANLPVAGAPPPARPPARFLVGDSCVRRG